MFSQIPIHYGELYTGPVRKYSDPFTMVLCGDLTPNEVEQARNAIRLAWLTARPDLEACNCFDITFINVEKLTDSTRDGTTGNGQINTQLTYVGLTNDKVIESSNSGPSNSPPPTTIQTALNAIGLETCYVRSSRSALLDVVVAKPSLEQSEFDALERFQITIY